MEVGNKCKILAQDLKNFASWSTKAQDMGVNTTIALHLLKAQREGDLGTCENSAFMLECIQNTGQVQ